ncbi:MAG TPA: RnfH family protein [Nevskiaceae bacterium]
MEVAAAWPDHQQLVSVTLEAGAMVRDALAEAGFGTKAPIGIFGRVVDPDHVLQSGDRVELYRPLTADPKQARRKRLAAAKKRV